MKNIIINSKIKPKSKTTLGVTTNLVLDFIIRVVTTYMRKCRIDVTSIQGTTQTILYIT